jgi:hypothetical protein
MLRLSGRLWRRRIVDHDRALGKREKDDNDPRVVATREGLQMIIPPITANELAKKLGRRPTVNEWLIANGRDPVKKRGLLYAINASVPGWETWAMAVGIDNPTVKRLFSL